jgi:N-acetyl-D-muramate 6-phosphate phosphatase
MSLLSQPKPQAILFDLDGTIADTAVDFALAINIMRKKNGFTDIHSDTIRPYASQGAIGILKSGLDIDNTHPDYAAYQKEFLDLYESGICEAGTLFDGVLEMLHGLVKIKMPWGIVTNKAERFTLPFIHQLCTKLHMPKPDVVVAGDTTDHPKPHPMPLLYACEKINITANKSIWYIGDDIRDIQAAAAANITGIACAYGYLGDNKNINAWGADVIINNIAELTSYINNI